MAGGEAGPGFGAQIKGAGAGLGCGAFVLVVVAVPLGLVWLVLVWFGARVPGLSVLGGEPPRGAGWLAISSVAALFVLLTGLGLIAVMFMSDEVPQPLPWRAYLFVLLVALPVADVVAIVAAWICAVSGGPDAARHLALVPWWSGAALAVTAAIVMSGLVAHDRSG